MIICKETKQEFIFFHIPIPALISGVVQGINAGLIYAVRLCKRKTGGPVGVDHALNVVLFDQPVPAADVVDPFRKNRIVLAVTAVACPHGRAANVFDSEAV